MYANPTVYVGLFATTEDCAVAGKFSSWDRTVNHPGLDCVFDEQFYRLIATLHVLPFRQLLKKLPSI